MTMPTIEFHLTPVIITWPVVLLIVVIVLLLIGLTKYNG